MRVRAKDTLYHNNKRYRAGEEFDLQARSGFKKLDSGKLEPIELTAESQFSERFMEDIDGALGKKSAPAEVSVAEKTVKKVSKKKAAKKVEAKDEASANSYNLDDDVI